MKNIKLTLLASVVSTLLVGSVLTACTSPSTTENIQSPSLQTTVTKSQNDQRAYRYVTLDNGLKVILVSDNKADKSAASIDVHIGHMADPQDREGLTHFLEHMLFLGTEKYPKVGEYNEYLKANGGWSNAGTGQEHTNYFFEVNQDAFEEAVDRFAQFFISPSLAPEYVDREKNAVHSEYSMKIKDDARRIREVLKDTTNQAHAASQFSVGNLDTLADRENDLLIDDLTAQYKEYYSASRMSLSLVGREDLDTLEQWAREKFGPVPNNGSVSKPTTVKPYLAEQLGVRIDIEPMKDTRSLTLHFPVPNSVKHFKEKPLELISSIMANEGQGSLFSYLKKQGLIETLSSYHYGPDDFEQLTVSMTLTPKGLKDYRSVTEAVFSYFKLLGDEEFNRQYFDELRAIAKINFDFKEKGSSSRTASGLSRQLQYFSPQHIIDSNYFYGDYSHQLVTEYLTYLTPENMRQVLVAKGVTTNKVQPLYDAPYAMNKLSESELKQYQSPSKISALKLPVSNPFIAKNLTLKTVESEGDIPEVISSKPGFKVWYKQDTEFRVPKAAIYVQIYSDEAGKDVNARAMNYLYTALLNDSLNEFGYPAKLAGLNYNVWSTNAGIGFGVSGYDEKGMSLIETINERIRHLSIDNAAFKLQKERLIRNWQNAKFNRPYNQARSAMRQIQKDTSYSAESLASALSLVTEEKLANYIKGFHQSIEVEALVHGNFVEAQAQEISAKLIEINMSDSKAKNRAKQVVNLNSSTQPLVRELVIDHNDSTLVMAYIGDDASVDTKAKYRLLSSMLNAAFFKSIRTDQQLGYIVSGRSTQLEDLPGMSFLIQSPKAGAIELNRRVDAFLQEFEETLTKMPADKFDEYKKGLVKDLLTKDKNLNERTSHYWSEINDKKFDFDSKFKIAKQVEGLQQTQMVEFYHYAFTEVKPIVVRSFGKAHQQSEDYQLSLKDKTICRESSCFDKALKASVRP